VQLVERAEELSLLQGLLTECAAGRGQLALVCGPVGSGKTELLYAFGEAAVEAGAVLLTATGSPVERSVPFGVLDQLLRGAVLPARVTQQLDRLLPDCSGPAAADAVQPVTQARVLRGCRRALVELAAQRPVVIGVDDIEHADPQSLRALLHLVRELRRSRTLLVFTVSAQGQRTRASFRTELLRHQHCRRLRLRPLSARGAAEVVSGVLGGERAEELGADYQRVTGGNPLLVHALLEDLRDAGATDRDPARPVPVAGPVAGPAFGQAVVACLHRGGDRALAVARAVAVLDRSATVPLLARLVGVEEFELSQALDDLEAAGLLTGVRYRHPVARRAVVADLPADQRLDLHRRAAELLYLDGAPAISVARHLVAADDVGHRWAVPLLREAGEQALVADELPYAAACLSLALRGCTDEADRVPVTAALAQVEWRLNPWTAARHLAPLTDAARAGRVSGRHLPSLVRSLLWHGRTREAVEALARAGAGAAADADGGEVSAADVGITRQLLESWHPPLVNELGELPAGPRPATDAIRADEHFVAASLLARVLTGGVDDGVVPAAEAILRGTELNDATLEQVESALLTLVYADQPDRACGWVEPLLREAAARRTPTWEARLAALRAEIGLRQGDLPAAERHARTALSRIPLRGWGVVVGAPLSTLVLASTAMGRAERAAEALRQPVPDAMLHTRFQLQYGYARGQHRLRAGRLHAALGDFLACGERAGEWGLDVPTLVPWRSGAATAYLRLGERAKARQLAERQLELTREGSRSRGMTLRVLAATRVQRHRTVLLREAVDVLQGAGDRLELAGALADLYRAHRATGESRGADALVRHALRLAKECRAEPLQQALLRTEADEEPEPPRAEAGPVTGLSLPGLGVTGLGELSKAERRVIALAAVGHTNREIAGKLFITVSTVEQHLTRAYRKLNVTNRADLAATVSRSA
jgi:DNA-binding CsgD family transcriptional regulator